MWSSPTSCDTRANLLDLIPKPANGNSKNCLISMKDWKQFAMNPDKLIGCFDHYLTLVVNPNSSERWNSEC